MSTILCPRCLFSNDVDGEIPDNMTCATCQSHFPTLYLDDGLDCPTDVVLSMGRTGNGKTTLLMAILGSLIRDPDLLSERTAIGTYSSHDENGGSDAINTARDSYGAFMSRGVLPAGNTLLAVPTPFYILDCPPDRQRRNLFLFDVAGEAFSDVFSLRESAPFTAQAKVLWVVVSLDRAGIAERGTERKYGRLGGNLWDMLDVYDSARAQIRADRGLEREPQALLVIFTKADRRGDDLPQLQSHLERTRPSSPEQRGEISAVLREWIRRETDGGSGALSRAEAMFERVEFCATSATGGDVVTDDDKTHRTQMKPQPRLVLDPLTWTWELTEWLEHKYGRRGIFRRRHKRR